MRTRREESANYSSVFINGKTLRFCIDQSKPITELKFPEFYDVSCGNKCETGKCCYCYASGNPKGTHYNNVVEKIKTYFGKMSLNERPYQVAIGGQQEPIEHPEFENVLKAFCELDIVPNITTNGVLVDQSIVDIIKKYCGGVAVTLHPHLEEHWRRAINMFVQNNIRTNIHIIVSNNETIEALKRIYAELNDKIEYYVLLPYKPVGYAKNKPIAIDYDKLEEFLDLNFNNANIALGANFYEFLTNKRKWNVSLYPPEIMSKYLVLDDNLSLYNNSFDMKLVTGNI
jgi:sulfatase maturation enzyme AslB (radical SAM superfamily)